MREFDLVVIGAGVAGLTAAMHAARCGLSVAVVERMGVGGQIAAAERIENFPGFRKACPAPSSARCCTNRPKPPARNSCSTRSRASPSRATGASSTQRPSRLKARAVIVAAGSALRSLGVPGEEAFLGRGVSHCASCDGHFFSGRTSASSAAAIPPSTRRWC